MPFTLRLYQRFPVHGSVTYNAGPFKGQRYGLEPFVERVETLGRFALAGWADVFH